MTLELPTPTHVFVSPIVYTNPDTGQKKQSTTWHYPGAACLTPNMIQLEYSLAQQLGYQLCGNCRNTETRHQLNRVLTSVVPETDLLRILADLPEGFEIRILFHPPGTTSTNRPHSPKVVWTSWIVEEPTDQ